MTQIEEKFLSRVSHFHTGAAFRGQEDAGWKLHSSAVRRLTRGTKLLQSNTPQFREMHTHLVVTVLNPTTAQV